MIPGIVLMVVIDICVAIFFRNEHDWVAFIMRWWVMIIASAVGVGVLSLITDFKTFMNYPLMSIVALVIIPPLLAIIPALVIAAIASLIASSGEE